MFYPAVWGVTTIDGATTEQFVRTVLETTSGMRLHLWLALLVAAPISEEMFFRGFLFTGLQNSRLGGYGAVFVTAGAFACIHVQYDLQGILFVLAVGAFFGLARLKTGSLWLCAALHSLLNLLSTLGFLLLDA